MPERLRQNAAVARGPERLAERFHQLRTGHCKRWKTQQKTPWAEVRKEPGRGKNHFTVRDLPGG